MIYVFFSDVHSQQDALEKLANHPEFKRADKKICLGDTFSADEYDIAESAFERVSSLADTTLLGNHEAYVAGLCDESVFSEVYRRGKLLKEKDRVYNPAFVETLSKLPRTFSEGNIQATHASFNPADEWHHVRYIEDLSSQEEFLTKKLNLIGHGHIPFIAWKHNSLWYYQRFIYGAPIILEEGVNYIANVGSVLGSRELRERERTFMTYDDTNSEVRFFNLEAV